MSMDDFFRLFHFLFSFFFIFHVVRFRFVFLNDRLSGFIFFLLESADIAWESRRIHFLSDFRLNLRDNARHHLFDFFFNKRVLDFNERLFFLDRFWTLYSSRDQRLVFEVIDRKFSSHIDEVLIGALNDDSCRFGVTCQQNLIIVLIVKRNLVSLFIKIR